MKQADSSSQGDQAEYICCVADYWEFQIQRYGNEQLFLRLFRNYNWFFFMTST